MRASERSPRSQVTHGSGEKPWREKGLERNTGLTTAAPGRGPALRLNRRRGAGGCSARLGPARRCSARRPRLHQGRGGETRGGRGGGRGGGWWRGEGAAPGTGATSSLPPTARGVADVRPCSGGFPARRRAETPGPHLAALGGGSPARAWTFAPGSCWEALESGCGGP